ncbi:MAG: helix-turn-helix domain-containing protein [Coleofasciculaceae cyanobacterium SM2_3_26]|nr:helix-turn-helix domain-containing protein [Coleofasciculaceae cyanobacterium SM2_3_26]
MAGHVLCHRSNLTGRWCNLPDFLAPKALQTAIAEIAHAIGFSSQSHLTRVFRRFLHTTPAAYRTQMR